MYCRQCGVQLPTNAKFCSKCGTQTTTNGNDVPNGQDTFFWISLLASILLLFTFAIYHTNLIGMTYVDWLFADCSDQFFDDSDGSLRELCDERQGQGIMMFFGLMFLTVATLSSYKSETDKKNSRKKTNFPTSSGTAFDTHNSIRDFTTDYNERKKIYENIESYVKQMVDLGYNEEIARQHAMSHYKQQSKISGKQPTEELIKENQK
jgi:hypothetical protein